MFKRICIYNNKVFLTIDCYLLVYCYNKFPESEHERFTECFKIKLPVKCTSTIDAKFDIIENYATGLKSLLIFLLDTNGNWNIFLYSDTFRKKLYEANLPTFSLGIKNSIFVSDGPTFLYHTRNAFHLYPLPCSGKKYSDFTFPFSGYKEFKVLQFKCFGPFQSSCQPYLYLLIISCNFTTHQSLKILSFVSNIKNPVTNFHQLTFNAFFPLYYETVLKAVDITKAIPQLKNDQLTIENIQWKETASVICTENECLIFSNANLQYCCKLTMPLTNIMLIETHFVNTYSRNVNLVLTLENKFVFFLEIKEDLRFEVVKHWTDIETAVIGDVLMKGSKEVLLLKHADLISWQYHITLYDMLTFMPIDVLHQSSLPDNCLKATISGLERKVKLGKSAIRDVELEISEKSAATVNALIQLNEDKVDVESCKSSNTFQESLVDLILSGDENKIKPVVSESEPCVKLLEEKHNFLNNKWIINLCFINESEGCICYPSIKILKKDCQLSCIQKLFVCNTDDNFFANECGREIGSKSKFYMVISVENLILQADDNVFMILSWYNGTTDEFDNEVFAKDENKVLTQNQICMQTRITLSDIFEHHTKRGISLFTDLVLFRSLQQGSILCVLSLHSDISRLENVLMESNGVSNNLYLLENSSTKCVVFHSDNSPLFGVHFVILKSTPNAVEIKAFTRTGSELCLLIYYLYQHLPKDVMISPHTKSKDEYTKVKRNLAISMKNEVDLLMSSFNVHNISEEMRKNYDKLISSQTAGNLNIPKTNYHRIRKVLVKKECITDMLFKSMNLDSSLV